MSKANEDFQNWLNEVTIKLQAVGSLKEDEIKQGMEEMFGQLSGMFDEDANVKDAAQAVEEHVKG